MRRFFERVSERAVKIEPGKTLKSVLALPFYLVGWIVGTLWFLVTWFWSALAVGFTDGMRRSPE